MSEFEIIETKDYRGAAAPPKKATEENKDDIKY